MEVLVVETAEATVVLAEKAVVVVKDITMAVDAEIANSNK